MPGAGAALEDGFLGRQEYTTLYLGTGNMGILPADGTEETASNGESLDPAAITETIPEKLPGADGGAALSSASMAAGLRPRILRRMTAP